MNIAEYSIRKSIIIWMMVVILTIGGIFAYHNLGRFEDPEFTIKEAKIITHYPGATPKEVEQEVTETIEKAIQQMGQVKLTTSISREGISDITVEIKDKYDKHSLPQIWDELRRKVNDIQRELPPGAGPSLVNDDFGDVFGMYLAMTGNGFSYQELENYADLLKKEISLVPGVAKVELSGEQQEVIYVDISRARLAQLGISIEQISNTIQSQNLVTSAGEVSVGDEYLVIKPTGALNSVAAVGHLLVRSGKTEKLIFLSDIAQIYRGYQEVPHYLVYYNGKPAIGIGISIVSGGNVVKIGEKVEARLLQLDDRLPIGLSLNKIYYQPTLVQNSINGFIVSLGQALIIVIAILLLFMGLRSGLIIASVLLLTVLGTLLIMLIFNINLERISLGALIIALGMLVDNAIVVAEGILIKVNQGVDKIKAAKEVVNQTIWPLFGATLIGVLAFAAIGLSQDSTGEYTISLFYVILISLVLSWFLAITIIPLFCYRFLKKQHHTAEEDPYKGVFFQAYKSLLTGCLKARWITTLLMIILLVVSIYGFRYVKQSFFPNSTTPMFYIDYWRAQGTDIRIVANEMNTIAAHIRSIDNVTDITTTVGGGSQRFMLVYSPEDSNQSYGQFLVGVKDYRVIDQVIKKLTSYFNEHYPHAFIRFEKIRLGPGGGDKIEVRLSGPDPKILRQLTQKVEDIMRQNPQTMEIRDDWRQKVKVIEPVYAESQARLTGINRSALSDALQMAFSGLQVGLYRENDKLIPIISRSPDHERANIGTIDDLQVWSPLLQSYVPIGQVVSQFKTVWRDDIIRRRDRKMTITPSCNPKDITASELFRQLAPKIQAIPLPTGYEMAWGGEHEDSSDAQAGLAAKFPLVIMGIFVLLILLFSGIRQPLVIWLCVPLSFIGVTAGLLLTGYEFGFMALLGFLSLIGMLIKNAIVLVDQIELEINLGKPPMQAIIDSAVSRVRPVSLAALTTVLGMIPLLFDAFFVSMAVVIMFGLTFATILTLIVVPVLYALFFNISFDPPVSATKP